MATHLIRPGAPTRTEQSAMIVTQEWKQFFLAALTGCCSDSECENPVEAAARIADKAIQTANLRFTATLDRMNKEGT